MTMALRPSPFEELSSLRRMVDRLFEDSFRPRDWPSAALAGPFVPLDVSTNADALVVEAALPGVRPEDVDVTVEDGTLTIRGRTAEDRTGDEGDYVVREIRRGEFARSLSLPAGLEPDRATATFENGILTLTVPKAERVKPRHIRITPRTDGQTTTGGAPTDERSGS